MCVYKQEDWTRKLELLDRNLLASSRASLKEIPLWTHGVGEPGYQNHLPGVQKAQERDGNPHLLHICLFLLSLTLPGSVTLSFSHLSFSLPCFQSAEAWV